MEPLQQPSHRHDQIVETIIPNKSPVDRNDYRIIRLKNGLKALLISTPLNIQEIDNAVSVHYSATEGPHFLQYGATARTRNLAADIFKDKPKKEDETSKTNTAETGSQSQETQVVEMASGTTLEDDDDDCEANSNFVQDLDEKQVNDEDYDDYEDFEAEEDFVERIAQGDEEALQILLSTDDVYDFLMNENAPNESTCPKTINPLSIGWELIPLDLSDIERAKDDARKLVNEDSQTKKTKNGVVSITYAVGSLSDHSSIIGLADLTRQVVQDSTVISVHTGFETSMTTFTQLCETDGNVERLFKRLFDPKEGGSVGAEDTYKKISKVLQSNHPFCNATSEIKNGLDCESWMLSDKKQLTLLYSLAKDSHPFKSVSPDFYLGLSTHKGKKTRSAQFIKDLNDNLKVLWKEKFCPCLATLILQSSETLECLESIVLKHVGNQQCEHPGSNESHGQESFEFPFDMKTFARLYKVIYTGPENLEPSLVMSWALSPELWKNCRSRSMEYVAWLISHKGEGGLFATLQPRAWITDIQAGCNHTGYHRNNYITLFQIKIKLTSRTVDTQGAIRLIVKTVFSYFNFLLAEGLQQELYEALNLSRQIINSSLEPESTALRNLQISFSHNACPLPKISVLGEVMQMIPEENLVDLLTMDSVVEYSAVDINQLLTSLDIDTCNFMLSNKAWEWHGGAELQEVYYGTKYSAKNLPPKWKAVNEDDMNLSPYFKMPDLCKTVDKCFNSQPLMFDDEDPEPILVLKNTHVNVWKKSNSNFKKMSAYIMHFASPLLNGYKPHRAAVISILCKRLNQLVVNELDPLKLTSLRYTIEPSHIGLIVKIFGYQIQSIHAVEFILQKYKELIEEHSRDPDIKSLKRELADDYKTALVRNETLARCVYNTLSVRNYAPLTTRLNALEDLTNNRYREEVELFKLSSTTGMLALGCCSQIHARELASKLPESSPEDIVRSLGKTEIFSYIWPLGQKFVRLLNKDMEKDAVYVSQHFQLSVANAKNKAFANILLEIVNAEILMGRNLRNQMSINARVNEFNSVLEFELIGSASNLGVTGVEEFLNDFMGVVGRLIKDSPEKCDFKTVNDSLAINRSCGKSHHSVINEFHDYERKVKDFSLIFHQIPIEGKMYGVLEHKEFYEWFSTNISKKIRKLTIQIVSTLPNQTEVKDKRTSSKQSRAQLNDEDENIQNPMTGYVLLKPGPEEKHFEDFITHDNIEHFKKNLPFYNPLALNSQC